VAIASWGIVTVSSNLGGRNKAIAKALDENAAVSETIRQRLEAIDGRLSAVEKTLNDIP
jgi:VIT1/CCC1 family predicted Fe2+/Mn2+ transporter